MVCITGILLGLSVKNALRVCVCVTHQRAAGLNGQYFYFLSLLY